MIQYRCQRCGAGELEPLGDGTAMCPYCHSIMRLPAVDPDEFNKATKLRQENQFSEAMAAFDRIIQENPKDPEAYWNFLLCKYGIEYVEDVDGQQIPTCHRMSTSSFTEDPCYQLALQYADGMSESLYRSEGQKIDNVLREIARIAAAQPGYDVFISYKESDDEGHTTEDAGLAQDIYEALKERHPELNIFLARVTLKEVAGTGYEPIIFSALNTARLMILVGTKGEYINSAWVQNEWGRYCDMMQNNPSKHIVVVYKHMNPAQDLPERIRLLQATEAAGYWQPDFVRGVEKLLGIDKKKTGPAAAPAAGASLDVRQAENLCARAEQAMEIGSWEEAVQLYRKAIALMPDSAKALWGLVRAETRQFTLINPQENILDQSFYQDWKKVEDCAEGTELDSCREQFGKYMKEWRAASNHQDFTNYFAQALEKTGNGKKFDTYEQYGAGKPDMTALEVFAESSAEDREKLSRFSSEYEKNYKAYLELQAEVKGGLLSKMMAEPEYQKAKGALTATDKGKKRTSSYVGGADFSGVIVYLIFIGAAFYFCTANSSENLPGIYIGLNVAFAYFVGLFICNRVFLKVAEGGWWFLAHLLCSGAVFFILQMVDKVLLKGADLWRTKFRELAALCIFMVVLTIADGIRYNIKAKKNVKLTQNAKTQADALLQAYGNVFWKYMQKYKDVLDEEYINQVWNQNPDLSMITEAQKGTNKQ